MKLSVPIRPGRAMSLSVLLVILSIFFNQNLSSQTLNFTTVESTCESNGSIMVTCTGCSPTVQFQISAGPVCAGGNCPINDSPDGTFASVPSGTYTIFAIGTSGLEAQGDAIVAGNYQEPVPLANYVYPCPGQSNAEINITGTNFGLAPFEYRAFVGVVGDYPGAIGPTEAALPFSLSTNFTGFATGVHSYQVKDACGVIRTGELVISDSPPLPSVGYAQCTNSAACETSIIMANQNGTIPYSDPRIINFYPMDVYLVAPDGTETLVTTMPSPQNVDPVLLPTCGGFYHLRIATACGTDIITNNTEYSCVSRSIGYYDYCNTVANQSEFTFFYSSNGTQGVCTANQTITVFNCGEENMGGPPLFQGLIGDFHPAYVNGESYHFTITNSCSNETFVVGCIVPVLDPLRWYQVLTCEDDVPETIVFEENFTHVVYEAPASFPFVLPYTIPQIGPYRFLLEVPDGLYRVGVDRGCGVDTFDVPVVDYNFDVELTNTEVTCQSTTFTFQVSNNYPGGFHRHWSFMGLGYENSAGTWVPVGSNRFIPSNFTYVRTIDNNFCFDDLAFRTFHRNIYTLPFCNIDLGDLCYQVPDGVSVLGLPCNDGMQMCDDGSQPYNILATAPEMNGLGPFTWEIYEGGTNTLFVPQIVTPDTFIVLEEVCVADLTLDIFVTDACGQQIMSEIGFGVLTLDLLLTNMVDICASDTFDLNTVVKPVVEGGTWSAIDGGPAPVNGIVTPGPGISGCFNYNYQLTPMNLPGICDDLDVPFELCIGSGSPSITCPDTLTVECDGMGNTTELEAWINTAMATGSCDGMGTSSISANIILSIPGNGLVSTNTYEFIADDGNGNTSVCTSQFIIEDTVAPVLVGASMADTVSCEENFEVSVNDWLNSMVATDTCGATTITTNLVSVMESCDGTNSLTAYTYSVVAEDGVGNTSATSMETFYVIDDTGPTIVGPEDLDISCGNENLSLIMAWINDYTVTEACQDYEVTNDWDGMIPNLCDAAMIPITWTVTDGCGASSTASANINVMGDTMGPIFLNCPTDITVNVDVDLCASNVIYSTPIATDCNGLASLDLISGSASGTAIPVGMETIVFMATDNCDNTSTCSFVITVVDSDIPSISCPSNAIEICTDEGECIWTSNTSINPMSMENCPDVLITHTIVSSDGSIDVTDAAGTIAIGTEFPIDSTSISYTITDAAGLTSTCSFMVIVSDCENPELMCPSDAIAQCDGMGNQMELAAFIGGASAMDNCDNNLEIEAQVFNTISSCGNTSTTTYQFTVIDESGNSSVCFADFVIQDTIAPIINTMATDVTVECDGNGNVLGLLSWISNNGGIVDSDVTEQCGDFEWQNNFANANFIANAECDDDIGYWLIDFWVVDDCGLMSETITLRYTIEDTTAPLITGPASILIQCGDTTNLSNLDNWLLGYSIVESCSNTIVENDFDPTMLPTSCGTSVSVTWTVTDDCGNTSTTTSNIEMVDDQKPIIMNPPLALYVECGDSSNLSDIADWLATAGGALVIDNCDSDLEISSELAYDISECTGSQVMIYSFSFTDDCGNVISSESYIEMIDTTAPAIDAISSDLNVICNGSGNTSDLEAWLGINGGAQATDACSEVTWSYSLISSLNLCGNTGTDTYVFEGMDDCGNMVTDTANFTIQASPINLTGGADYSTECEDSNAGNDDELISWLNNNAGIIADNPCGIVLWSNNFDAANWIDGCNDGRNIDVTFFASDECGNMDSLTFNFSTSDNTSPEFINCPLQAYVFEVPAGSCEAYANFSLPIAEDNCGTPTVEQTDTTGLSSGSLFPLGLTTLEFTATDECGNSSSCIVEIQVNDLSYNLLIECPEDVSTGNDLGECGAVVDSISLIIVDNICDIENLIEFEITDSLGQIITTGTGDASGTFFNLGTNTVKYTITDQYGNIDSCLFEVEVLDIEAPVCAGLNDSVYEQLDTIIAVSDLDCGANFEWTHPILSDNCSGGSMEVNFEFINTLTGDGYSESTTILAVNGTIDLTGSITSRLFEVGITTVTYILTDASGNLGFCSFIVTVEAEEAPEFNAGCEDLTISLDPGDCIASINPPIDLSNTCGIDTIIYSSNGETIDLNQIPIGTTTVLIEAIDIYGNVGSCSFDISVEEYANPTSTIGCNGDLNISLGADCEAIVTPDMILEGGPYGCYDNYCMEIIDENGVVVDNIFDLEDVGETFSVSIIDCNGNDNSCWGYITIENKLIPELDCPDDVTLTCNQDPSEIYPIGHVLEGELVYGMAELATCETEANITYKDVLQDYGECNDPRVELIRTWTVVDESGNEVSCDQNFDFLPFDPAMVVYPPEFILDNSFDCTEVADDPSLTEPGNTGYPTFGGQAIIGNNYCDIHLGYWDEVLVDVNCPSAYIIYRNWKIDNECLPIEDGVNPLEFIQRIKVKDTKAPIISGLEDVTINVDPWSCEGEYTLPQITNTDDCSEFEVEWHASYGQIVGNQVTNLLKGVTTINVKVSDGCGNQSFGSFTITAVDLNPPTIISETQHTVSLAQDGIAKVYATDLDDGSYDGCGGIGFAVIRMDEGADCLGQDYFAPAGDDNAQLNEIVHFCCTDVGTDPIMVQLRVCDDADGNSIYGSDDDNCNLVMVEVFVQEKLVPQIICPDPVTISCIDLAGIDLSDTDLLDELFGTAIAAGTCGVELSQTAVGNEACGAGVVFRNFTATNSVGTSSCQQIITVTAGPNEALTCERISFESISNSTYNWCSVNDNSNDNDDDLPALIIDCADDLEIPNLIIDINGLCTEVGEQTSVDTFLFAGGACKKYIIHYELIDQCIFDENFVNVETGEVDPYHSDNGYFEFYLEVDAFDSEEPTPICETINVTAQSCEGYVGTFSASGTDNCTDEAYLAYQWRLDLGADNTIDYPVSGWVSTSEVSEDQIGLAEFPIGQHTIFWIISDGCGNDASCAQTINIMSEDKEPTPYCFDGLSVAVMPSTGTVGLWAKDFDAGSFDNCGGELTFTMVPESEVENMTSLEAYGLSFNHPQTTQQANGDWGFDFDCTFIPNGVTAVLDVRIYVTDADGNWDYCTASLRLDDNFDACENDGSTVEFENSGSLKTEFDEAIHNVLVEVDASYPEFPMSQMADGNYSFDLIENIDYSITPTRNDNFLNGITTLDIVLIQKHILGLELLATPYQLIAADVNSDCNVTGIDIIQLRKLLLGKYSSDELPDNTSWRFVESDYDFVNEVQPCNYSEVAEIFNLSENEINNFIGVKIGDVNGNADANLAMDEIDNRSLESLNLAIAYKKTANKNEYLIDFMATEYHELFGMQFNLDFEMSEFLEIKSGVLELNSSNLGFSNSNKTVYFSYDVSKGVSINEGDILFSILLNVSDISNLTSIISMNTRSFVDEAYIGNLLIKKSIDILYPNEESNEKLVLHQNEPNPFVDKTKIVFEIPEAGEVTLTVYDLNGKELYRNSNSYSKGINNLLISKKELQSTGVLYYKLEMNNMRAIKKMLVLLD